MRIISRLDIKNEDVIKGINFEGLRVVGKPNKLAKKYYREGIDELIYSDDRFEQEWCLYMDLMRPISYFKKNKNTVMKINQIRHILEVILSIQDNKIGKITNFF